MADDDAKDEITVELKPPNTNTKFMREKPNIINKQPNVNKPLSLSAIDSFQSNKSDDEHSRSRLDTSILKDVSSLRGKSSLKRTKSRSLFQKRKLQRVVSKRFNTNKRVIKKALSQFLEDEEFDANSMKTDLQDPDGYIIDHLAVKFNWDTNTRQQFYSEVSTALRDDETSRHNRKPSKSISRSHQSMLKSDTTRTVGGTHYLNYDSPLEIHEEEHKGNITIDLSLANDNNNNDNDTNGYNHGDDAVYHDEAKYDKLDPDDDDDPEQIVYKQKSTDPNDTTLKEAEPLKQHIEYQYSKEEKEQDVLSNDEENDEIGVGFYNHRANTQTIRLDSHYRNHKRRTRYPEYVLKAIFYAADDEHVEVLLDQAINFIANDPRFSYLWHDEKFIELLYSDKTYSQAVEKLMKEIKDIEYADKADFFHQFVYREYDREIKNYLRDLLSAEDDESFRNRARASSSMHFENVEDYMNQSSSESVLGGRSRSLSVPDATKNAKYTLKYIDKTEDNVDITFKIREQRDDDKTKYKQNKATYFKLPTTSPNTRFMWAQYQRKKIKRYDKGNKLHGYWKLLKAEDEDKLMLEKSSLNGKSPSTNSGEATLIEMQNKPKKKGKGKNGKKKAPPIPISHLNQILGLMRFYTRQQKLAKDREWIYDKCEEAFTFKDKLTDDKLIGKKDILVTIQDGDDRFPYNIVWWNGGDGFDDCVALAIRKKDAENKFYFYLCFKANIEDKIEWQWYNNDESYFQKYESGFDTFAQLEASFQACLHTNFPFNIMANTGNNNNKKLNDKNKNQIDESYFNLPCIPELVKAMKKEKKNPAQHYIIRYLFTKSKRIQDMEQLSVNRSQPEYPRRVKRMIAGTNQNTLFAYFLKDSDFVNEWKERFLLSEETQIYFFWSFILAIATTMKYMELELENQFITFSFRRNNKGADSATFSSLDTSDLRREIRDLDLFEGFIVPPYQIMQTQDVFNTEDQLKPVDWYRTLSTVGILHKRKYFDNFGGTLHEKSPTQRKEELNNDGRYDTCPHDLQREEYPWKGKLGTLYCDRCANMMRFGEYLRKFCLEYENRELIQFLWPWHKNTFHMKDTQKYHEAIARQNFNFLFDCEDLLNYVPMQSMKEEIVYDKFDADKSSPKFINKSQSFAKANKLKEKFENDAKNIHRQKVFEAHIRHKRKYTARFMLGAWESLKNLNMIKIQMGAVFEQLEIDRVHSEVAGACKESILIHNNKNDKNEEYEAKEWKMTNPSVDWPKWLSNWNTQLRDRLKRNHWLMILKLNKFKQLDIQTMSPKQLPNWDSFLQWALSPIYVDAFHTKPLSDSDLSEDDDMDWFDDDDDDDKDDNDYDNDYNNNGYDDDDEYRRKMRKIKSEATLQKRMMNDWKKKFKQSWTRVPHWWHIGHDKVLIELAVTNMFQERKYHAMLTKKGAYYRMRLNQSIGEQDYTQDIAFQEFKNWCIRWENIMHRVRYISAVVARQLSSIKPSIVELLIDDKNDRPTWSCASLVFLNDNQRDTHIQRIIDLPKPRDFHKTLKEKQFSTDELSLINATDSEQSDEETHLLVVNKFQNQKSVRRLAPKFEKTKTQFIEDEIAQNRFSQKKGKKIDWAQLFKECRIRDPFMIRDLGFELKEILNTFDLVTFGDCMASFVIELLRTRNLKSLWTFLGVLLKTMPNKTALKLLYKHRTQLRRANPRDLDWICRQVIQGTRFIIPACLFLSHFMKENARDDLARNGVWEGYSKQYEEFAAEQVASVEDDFMLIMLMNIPVYMKEISLIQLALEQHNTLFLNTERVNRIITHIWFTANPLNPHIEMLSHKKNPKRNIRDSFAVLRKKPIYFYLTPFGYQWIISLLFTVYVICVIVFVALSSDEMLAKKDDLLFKQNHDLLYQPTMSYFERVIWFMNLGFIFAEFVQFYSLGRAYFSVDGATNFWDIVMSLIWCVLAGMRFIFLFKWTDTTELYKPPVSSFRRRRLKEKENQFYCPPDFFSCKVEYNDTCIAEISAETNQIISYQCSDSIINGSKRQLQDSDSVGGDSNVDTNVADVFYDPADFEQNYGYDENAVESALQTASVNSDTGFRCTDVNITIPSTDDDYFWNETCLNYNQTMDVINISSITNTTECVCPDISNILANITTTTTNTTNTTNSTNPGCIITIEQCVQTFDSQLLIAYNTLWAVQIAMLTIRLLSYFESAGGFFGILLRIVRSMFIEVLKFGVIIVIVTTGFLFAIYWLFAHDINTYANATFTDLYDVIIFFFKLLFGGGNVGTIDTFYQNYRVFAQILIMVFAILGVRMFMSLLIALMSGAMNSVRSKAKAETSFTSALYAYELSTSPRIMPMPLNVVVFIISLTLHIINFIPAMLLPNHLNIYAFINQKRLFLNHKTKRRDINSPNHMSTRRRVFSYYITSLIPCLKTYFEQDWRIHHIGCYNSVIGIYGTEQIQAVSTNEYYTILETKRKHSEENRKLNVYDKLFLKHLTLKTLFCKHCFRPIALEDVRSNLLTPFQALTNIISCYVFLMVWPFLIPFFFILGQIERLIQYWTEELRAHSPKLLLCRQREYDLEYFPRSAVKFLSVRTKTKKDFDRLGTGGPDVNDVDVNYDEMDDAGE